MEYAKENKLRSYIQHVWLKAASLVHIDAKAIVRWEVKKNDGRCRIFRTKSVENWYGRRLLVQR